MSRAQQFVAILVSLASMLPTGCTWRRPMPPEPTPQMYQAAIDAFFRDNSVQRVLGPEWLDREVVYIRPTFDGGAPVPAEIIQDIATHTSALGLARVASEQQGGAVIAIDPAAGFGPEEMMDDEQEGPMVRIEVWVSGKECETLTGLGYGFTPTLWGWEAQVRESTVC